jgi:hypothetical protein
MKTATKRQRQGGPATIVVSAFIAAYRCRGSCTSPDLGRTWTLRAMPYSDPKGPAPSTCASAPSGSTTVPASTTIVNFSNHHRTAAAVGPRTRATQAIQVGISRSCPNVVAMPSPVSFGMSASPACLLRRTLDDRRLALRSTDGVRGRTRRCLPRHPTGGRGRRQDRPPAARAASSMKLSTAQLVQPGPTER